MATWRSPYTNGLVVSSTDHCIQRAADRLVGSIVLERFPINRNVSIPAIANTQRTRSSKPLTAIFECCIRLDQIDQDYESVVWAIRTSTSRLQLPAYLLIQQYLPQALSCRISPTSSHTQQCLPLSRPQTACTLKPFLCTLGNKDLTDTINGRLMGYSDIGVYSGLPTPIITTTSLSGLTCSQTPYASAS